MILTKSQIKISVADLVIQVNCKQKMELTENFKPFKEKKRPACIFVNLQAGKYLPTILQKSLYEAENFSVFKMDGNFIRRYMASDMNGRNICAVSCFYPEINTVQVDYLSNYARLFKNLRTCFDYIGFEELLMQNNRFILHSSLISTDFGGVLFTGPSGIGKSTQADLWIKYMGARLINGDRSIIRPGQHGWLAAGSPYAGSSNCFVNESVPIKAIVVLEHGDVCTLDKLNQLEAFQEIYSGTTINFWNEGYVKNACDLIEKLVSQVPVYRLTCTPDEHAVETLYRQFTKGD